MKVEEYVQNRMAFVNITLVDNHSFILMDSTFYMQMNVLSYYPNCNEAFSHARSTPK